MNAQQLIDKARTLTFSQVGFCEMEGVYSFRLLRCNEEPRLTILTSFNVAAESYKQTWQVDGVDFHDSKDAFGALVT